MEETMNRFAFAAFAAVLVGCPTDDKTDSGGTDTDSTDACPTTFPGPTTVQSASVTCNGEVVTIDVETAGWTGDGYVYMLETANNMPWAEEHDLTSYDFDPCGAWDKLDVELTGGADPWERNVGSLFTCAAHFEGPVMTYAAAVLDVSGAFADCMA